GFSDPEEELAPLTYACASRTATRIRAGGYEETAMKGTIEVCMQTTGERSQTCRKCLLGRHVFPFASILARISDFSTLPTLERGRSSQTSICFGAFTLPILCLTKLDTA